MPSHDDPAPVPHKPTALAAPAEASIDAAVATPGAAPTAASTTASTATARDAVLARAREARRVILVLGPTAGGKSDLALELARRLDGELVSADSMQVYRGMDVGTAKPTAAERAEIPHHLIDLVDATDEGFTVARWLALADAAVEDVLRRGRTPIVVGGTNLYVRAFLEGLDAAPEADAAFRASLEGVPSEELHARLATEDPAAAARLHPNDRRRVIRALEIGRAGDAAASARRTAWSDAAIAPRRADLFTAILDWPVEAINRRINARVRAMVERGFIDEVRGLLARGGLCAQARAACGYAEIADAIATTEALGRSPRDERRRSGVSGFEAALEATKIRSRRLAKQQRTWLKRFRGLEPSIAIACDDAQDASTRADLVVARLADVASARTPSRA